METQEQKIEKVDIIEDKVDIVEKSQQNAEINTLTLIDKAIEKDIDVDKFAKLVDIVKMLENEKAKRDFYEALSNFQGEVPPIKKLSRADMGYGKPKYNYAEFGEIVTTIQEPLKRNGLSYHFEIGNEPVVIKGEKDEDVIVEFIAVTCTVAHKSGYEKTTTMSVQKDAGAGKSNVQAVGSTITYLKRYTLLALLGIGTADPDDDAVSTIPENQKNVDKKEDKSVLLAEIKDKLDHCNDEETVKKIWSKYQKYSNDADVLNLFTEWRKKQAKKVEDAKKVEKINKPVKTIDRKEDDSDELQL
jgi:hypothetical protein